MKKDHYCHIEGFAVGFGSALLLFLILALAACSDAIKEDDQRPGLNLPPYHWELMEAHAPLRSPDVECLRVVAPDNTVSIGCGSVEGGTE